MPVRWINMIAVVSLGAMPLASLPAAGGLVGRTSCCPGGQTRTVMPVGEPRACPHDCCRGRTASPVAGETTAHPSDEVPSQWPDERPCPGCPWPDGCAHCNVAKVPAVPPTTGFHVEPAVFVERPDVPQPVYDHLTPGGLYRPPKV